MSLLDRDDVPLAKSRASTSAVDKPLVTASSAIPAPVTPPPTTSTSTAPPSRRSQAAARSCGPRRELLFISPEPKLAGSLGRQLTRARAIDRVDQFSADPGRGAFPRRRSSKRRSHEGTARNLVHGLPGGQLLARRHLQAAGRQAQLAVALAHVARQQSAPGFRPVVRRPTGPLRHPLHRGRALACTRARALHV